MAGFLLGAVAVVAVAEGYQRDRGSAPFRLGVAALAVLIAAAALLCLFGLATGGLHR